MENRQNFKEIRYIATIPILLVLMFIIMLAMNIREAAVFEGSDTEYFVNPEGISDPSNPEEPSVTIDNTSYDESNHTLTLNEAQIDGTLTFNASTAQGTSETGSEMHETYYTIYLQPGTTSSISHMKLGDKVTLTIKGEGALNVTSTESENNGAPLSFGSGINGADAVSKLIIEGGTVTFEANYLSDAIKESGCLYVKEGAKSVTIIGQTNTNKDNQQSSVKKPIIQSESDNAIPKIFSDYPCQAEYIPTSNDGKEVILSPNGTSNGSSDKTYSDTSLLGDEFNQFHKLVFKPGYTATWQNDDGSVLETDKCYYWAGQVPEYNGDTPTKAEDAQYTYTFTGWSKTVGAIYKDTTYVAVYSTTKKQYTLTYDANGHGTAPESQTVDYGTIISRPTDPTADGWIFGGWYTDRECIKAYDFNSEITGNITIYAKWTEDKRPYNEIMTVPGKIQEITSSEKVKEGVNPLGAKIQNSSELKSLLSLTDAEIAKGVNVWLEVSDTTSSVSNSDKSKVLQASSGYTIGMYLDINLFKKVGSDDATKVSETNGKVKVSFVVPANLRKSGRSYRIVRVHNGVATVITGTYDEKTHVITFETDGFSTYALAYSDGGNSDSSTGNKKTVTKSPKTLEANETMMWYALFLVSCAGLYVSGVSKKRK